MTPKILPGFSEMPDEHQKMFVEYFKRVSDTLKKQKESGRTPEENVSLYPNAADLSSINSVSFSFISSDI